MTLFQFMGCALLSACVSSPCYEKQWKTQSSLYQTNYCTGWFMQIIACAAVYSYIIACASTLAGQSVFSASVSIVARCIAVWLSLFVFPNVFMLKHLELQVSHMFETICFHRSNWPWQPCPVNSYFKVLDTLRRVSSFRSVLALTSFPAASKSCITQADLKKAVSFCKCLGT